MLKTIEMGQARLVLLLVAAGCIITLATQAVSAEHDQKDVGQPSIQQETHSGGQQTTERLLVSIFIAWWCGCVVDARWPDGWLCVCMQSEARAVFTSSCCLQNVRRQKQRVRQMGADLLDFVQTFHLVALGEP